MKRGPATGHPRPPVTRLHREVLERAGGLLDLGALVLRQRDQAAIRKKAVRAEGAVAGELRDILLDARDGSDMRLLDVEEERAGHRVGTGGDVLEARLAAVDDAALQPVEIGRAHV